MDKNPVTRRAMIGVGTLGSAAMPTTDTAYMDDLTASSQRIEQAVRESFAELLAVERAFEATLTPSQRDLFRDYEAALTGNYIKAWEFYVAELARHLPALAPAIVTLFNHITDGGNTAIECCRVADWGGEPPPAA